MHEIQHQCQNLASFRYTWPGRSENYICKEHVEYLKSITNALGFYLQIIPCETQNLCEQKISTSV